MVMAARKPAAMKRGLPVSRMADRRMKVPRNSARKTEDI